MINSPSIIGMYSKRVYLNNSETVDLVLKIINCLPDNILSLNFHIDSIDLHIYSQRDNRANVIHL